jgi:hypothetical protein
MTTLSRPRLYDEAFYAWTRVQAEELRRLAATRPNLPLDLELIAEEIQDLGKSERDAVFSLTQRIIEHLLLIECSPARHLVMHWQDEIDEFREQVGRKITPTIKRQLEAELGEFSRSARRRIDRKTRRDGEEAYAEKLPARRAFPLEQLLEETDY